MATIVMGMGTSHGPMLSTPPEEWRQRVEADRKSNELWFQGKAQTFDDLVQMRKSEGLEKELTTEVFRTRYAACRKAIERLADAYCEVRPDVAVIIGDDQKELLTDELMPAWLVYCGSAMDNVPLSEEQRATLPPGIAIAEASHVPPEARVYPGEAALATHLVQSLALDGFEVARSNKLPGGRFDTHSVPHAYGFVHRQIMRDEVIPNIPIFINTFYPPNQPTLPRTYAFGKSLARAIQGWDSDKTVAVIASGGLTHFVVEEDLDQLVLKALRNKDDAALTALPAERFNSGTSEIRNWIAVAGAMAETALQYKEIDYVPCYRSLAGTGNAMGFAYWR